MIIDFMQAGVVVLSLGLIVVLSIATFKGVEFLHDSMYMKFQFFVCLFFIADFFVELWFAPRGSGWQYVRRRWFFLLISIPYLNLIYWFNVPVDPEAMYYIRFIPLMRCAFALSIVLGYISSNRITSLLTSYISILVMVTYFAGLIFYEREHPVNPLVVNYWDAFWWGMMQATTLGCDIYPVTPIGKALSVLLSFMGIIMFPLFTVYLSNVIIKRYRQSHTGEASDASATATTQDTGADAGDTSTQNIEKNAKQS